MGTAPKTITDPVTVMLWGVTDERIQEWLEEDGAGALTGFAGLTRGRRGRGSGHPRP